MPIDMRNDLLSVAAILGVLVLGLWGFSDGFGDNEIDILAAVSAMLTVFEVGRHTERHNLRKTPRKKRFQWLSVGRIRMLVALFATILMMAITADDFNENDFKRIGILALAFGAWEGGRVFWVVYRDRLAEIDNPAGEYFRIALEAMLKAVGTAVGQWLAAGVFTIFGWLARSVF